jgi:hypothetical protein
MTIYEIDRLTRGGSDVVWPDPKPAKGAHWNKSIRAARTYANSWAREYVKLVYYACVTCGGKIDLEWAHVLSGKGDSVHWEVENMTRQCKVCNDLHEYEPEHLVAWFVETYGQPALYELTLKANTNVKLGFGAVMKIGDRYRQRVKEMKE